jgi:hypothetical protein
MCCKSSPGALRKGAQTFCGVETVFVMTDSDYGKGKGSTCLCVLNRHGHEGMMKFYTSNGMNEKML